MIARVIKKIIGSRNERLLKKFHKIVRAVNALEPEMASKSDNALRATTDHFKAQLAQGASLESLLPEAFALVREASKRVLKMRHFDVQLVGGMALHQGKIAEMRTGEGKTLVATLPLYLNALQGKGVHLVTVNDYLAKRDAEWNRPLYEFLGLTVGVIVHGLERSERQAAYAADITYGTNNEFAFDYLRDNMVYSPEERVQRGLVYALVDEVDSILIDEARTPLIISGADQECSEFYVRMNTIIPRLVKQQEKDGPGDFSVDEKARQVFLTEEGHIKVEKLLTEAGLLKKGDSLYDASCVYLMHYLYASLKAHALFKRDVDYIVSNDQVVIVDEHTGRLMPGRRWSEGIHQAAEAKEHVPIEGENQTLASITFQNYFRMYEKLAGMTGTADTEAYEFQQIYGLETVVIPTNQPSRRIDQGDLIYLTQEEKFDAIVQDIEACVKRRQPVLVGTISIETSEYLSSLLKKKHIAHQVLNAKQHEREAEIIAEAGRPGSVTIATNMAGRGTDIVLGGRLSPDASPEETALWQSRHQEVVELGGLYVLGTERHESRRIDNQLRGRCGRQGDPGLTRFYLSTQDNLMRIFISEKISSFLARLGMQQGEAITHPFVTRAVENAQKKVEGHHFDIRKQLLEFDDVANEQRKVIYSQRKSLMEADDISYLVTLYCLEVAKRITSEHFAAESEGGSLEEPEDKSAALLQHLDQEYGIRLHLEEKAHNPEGLEDVLELDETYWQEKITEAFQEMYAEKESQLGKEGMRQLEKNLLLSVLDTEWKEHLAMMEHLRHTIHLRGYAQKDPKQEYKREAFLLFEQMLETIKQKTIGLLMRIQVKSPSDVEAIEQQWRETSPKELHFTHDSVATSIAEPSYAEKSQDGREVKLGRNQICPCGSQKKYKHCHGRLV